jgi:hypothetical protein
LKFLVVDDLGILHKGGDVQSVIALFDWGCSVISRSNYTDDYCADLEKFLSRDDVSNNQLKAIRAWLETQPNNGKDEP